MDDEIILDGCYSHFIQSEHINVIFDPLNDECIQYYAERAHAICTDSNTYTYCDARDMVKQNLSCFALRYLVIEYTCEGKFIFNMNTDNFRFAKVYIQN